jgi:hypothetical protein
MALLLAVMSAQLLSSGTGCISLDRRPRREDAEPLRYRFVRRDHAGAGVCSHGLAGAPAAHAPTLAFSTKLPAAVLAVPGAAVFTVDALHAQCTCPDDLVVARALPLLGRRRPRKGGWTRCRCRGAQSPEEDKFMTRCCKLTEVCF